jgi:DNA-binding NarL/FixJ family response regulator
VEYGDRMTIRIVIAEDHYLIREGIASLLAREPNAAVVAQAQNRAELELAIATHQPDVVVTDIRMPPGHSDEGIQVATMLRHRYPRTGVVVLSQYLEPAYALALLRSGSEGRAYLLKERLHDGRDLILAIEAVHGGGSVIDPQVIDALMRVQERKRASVLDELTAREREVLAHLAQGSSNGAIAEALVLTKRAVEKHVNAIFSKLGLTGSASISPRVTAALMILSESADRVAVTTGTGASPRLGDAGSQ